MNPYQRREAERKSIREKMLLKDKTSSSLRNTATCCVRCNGRMTLERFGCNGSYFLGMRCLLCGDVIDPVILLHRLSRDPQMPVPEPLDEVILMIRKYAGAASDPA